MGTTGIDGLVHLQKTSYLVSPQVKPNLSLPFTLLPKLEF